MKAVIFDLGNVLVRYDHDTSLRAVAAQSNMDTAGLCAILDPLSVGAGTGELDAAQLYAVLVHAAGLQTDLAGFMRLFASGIARDEAALAYAVALQNRPGVTVAAISNTNAAHVAWLDDHVPELRLLDLVMMSNEVGILKPASAIFRLALELLDITAEHAIFVDDLAVNVEAARALGMAGIVHHDWAQTRPALEAWLSSGTSVTQAAPAN